MRPVPALAVEARGVGERLGIGPRDSRRVDGRLLIAIELLHGEHPRLAAGGERLQQGELQAMVLGVVMRLPEEHMAGLRGTLEQFLGRDVALRPGVPDAAGERLGRRVGAGGQHRARQEAGNSQGRRNI